MRHSPAPLEAGFLISGVYAMSELKPLAASPRDRAGKGAARAARREGFVPAVIYGGNDNPLMIKVSPRDLMMELRQPAFYGTQFNIDVDGTKHRVLPRDVQFHPVTDNPIHVDFLRVTDRTRVNVNVPVVFENEEESPGLSRGGVLNVVRHEVEVIAAAGNLPERLVFDLTGKEIGDSVHISEIDLGQGVKPAISDRDFTVATIAAPTVIAEEQADDEAEDAEGEATEGGDGEETDGDDDKKEE
jgi:large subunit ribosomal protein L25